MYYTWVSLFNSFSEFKRRTRREDSPSRREMKAVRVHQFGGPEVLQVEETHLIDSLGPTQVLVKVMYAGVNPVETYIR